MQQDTKNKFAAILAAAQQKAGNKTVTNFTSPEPEKQPEPLQEVTQPGKLAKMLSFTILWHEGTNEYENTTFATWYTAKKAFCKIYDDYKESGGLGYDKVKCCIKWENGHEITDRVDVGNGSDFNPYVKTFKEFLQPQKGAMYQSNLQVGDRANLSFEDSYLNTAELQAATIPEFLASPNFINDAAQDETDQPELSTLTSADLLSDNIEPKNGLQIIDYSDKAFAVIGETKPIKDVLKALGGKYNAFLKCGKGWIFPKTRYEAVKVSLSL